MNEMPVRELSSIYGPRWKDTQSLNNAWELEGQFLDLLVAGVASGQITDAKAAAEEFSIFYRSNSTEPGIEFVEMSRVARTLQGAQPERLTHYRDFTRLRIENQNPDVFMRAIGLLAQSIPMIKVSRAA